MITETGQLNPYLETNNEAYKELVDLYNNWYAEICLLSICDWLDSNENWKKMHEYCNEHKDILKKFWLENFQHNLKISQKNQEETNYEAC